ncbi:MAG: hypothetical protein JXC36_07775 [Candidatus Atribacteria bacterium]|nr:hypothetical protein [Candidatus Atribacteria bacterium]MBN2747639.1 hypothetical protein [Bacteroidales bacterium]
MKKKTFSNQEIKKTLKSRLNSQRRIYSYDYNYVLVLPFLEHEDIDIAVNSIKFFINVNADYVVIDQIKHLCMKDNKAILLLENGDSFNLHYRRMDGLFSEVKYADFSLAKISIDHVPSIYIVLYSHYLRQSQTFNVLTEFSNSLSVNHWNTEIIKSSGFRNKVEKALIDSIDKDVIIEAYKSIFNDINLEITISENNNANLSVESLEYYKQKN